MSVTVNAFNSNRDAWRAIFGTSGSGFDFGSVKKVDPSGIKIATDEIKRGTTGKHVLGRRIVALTGSLKIQIADVTKAAIGAAMPWALASPSATGPWNMFPYVINADLYTYANLLTLHPNTAADGTFDINFCKAVPMSAYNMPRTGEEDDLWEIEFAFFPDRTRFFASPPVLSYGWVGATDPQA